MVKFVSYVKSSDGSFYRFVANESALRCARLTRDSFPKAEFYMEREWVDA